MRFYLALALLFSGMANGKPLDDVTKARLVHVLNNVNKKPLAPTVDCLENMGDIVTASCGRKSSSIEEDVAEASYMLNQMLSQTARYEKNPQIRNTQRHKEALKRIRDNLICMRNTMARTQNIYCVNSCKETYIAYNIPVLNPFMYNVTLCPRYFTRDKHDRAAIMIHEISHICGTDDYKYIFDAKGVPTDSLRSGDFYQSKFQLNLFGYQILNVKKANYHSTENADNYRYWAKYGFCLPGYDCK